MIQGPKARRSPGTETMLLGECEAELGFVVTGSLLLVTEGVDAPLLAALLGPLALSLVGCKEHQYSTV